VELRRERRARLNECFIGWQRAGHVDGDCGDHAASPAVGRHEAAFSDGTLCDHDLVGDRRQTD